MLALSHMMRLVDHATICVHTLRQNNRSSLDEDFTKLIHTTPRMALCVIFKHVNSNCAFIDNLQS